VSGAAPGDAVSFVVAAYNVGPHLGATLTSLHAACGPHDEIVVVDDGSPDDGAAIAAAHPAAQAGLLRLLRQPNQGVARTRLAGLAAATRPWVWFFDGDDLLLPGALARVRPLLREPAPDVLLFDFEFFWDGPPARRERSPLRSHPPGQRLHEPARWVEQAFDDAISALWSRVARRSLYDAVLPARCPAWSRYEDLAASPHVLAAARSLHYLPEPLVGYRQRAGSLSVRWSLDGCENLLRSALAACEVQASMNAAGLDTRAVGAAARRMLVRKAVEAIRRAAEAGATADDILQRLARPLLQALGADAAATQHELQASPRAGDRRIAGHLAQLRRWPRVYASWRVLIGRHQQRRRR
jgi:Glycosyl transferase family 2